MESEMEDQEFLEEAMQMQKQEDREAELDDQEYMCQVMNEEAEAELLRQEENDAYL